jgi:polyisoprenoid-binding protein YceI
MVSARVRRCAAAWLASVFGLAAAWAPAADGPWRIVRGEVRALCPLTLGGGFEAKTTALSGSVVLSGSRPASLAGELTVDLRTLDSGIELRNRHLREQYLEVGRGEGFETAVLADVQLAEVDATSVQGQTRFSATLRLHGTKRPVSGQAEVRREGVPVRVQASFVVALADYGIPKPEYLGVGVKNEIQVKVSLVAVPDAAPPAGAR